MCDPTGVLEDQVMGQIPTHTMQHIIILLDPVVVPSSVLVPYSSHIPYNYQIPVETSQSLISLPVITVRGKDREQQLIHCQREPLKIMATQTAM